MNDREVRKLLLDIVSDLNLEIFEFLETNIEDQCVLEYYDIGNVYGVKFLGVTIFDCQDSVYEDSEGNCILNKEYFKTKMLNIITNLSKIIF